MFLSGKYDDLCALIKSLTEADGVLLLVFDGKKGSGVTAEVPRAIYEALPDHLRTLADQYEHQIKGPRLTQPGLADLGDGLRVMKSPAGHAINIFDERYNIMMPIRNESAAMLFDWLAENIQSPEPPIVTRELIEQGKQCGCMKCEACLAMQAASRSPGDMSDAS